MMEEGSAGGGGSESIGVRHGHLGVSGDNWSPYGIPECLKPGWIQYEARFTVPEEVFTPIFRDLVRGCGSLSRAAAPR